MLFVNLSWKEANKDDYFLKSRGRGVNWLMLGIGGERERKEEMGCAEKLSLGILIECCLYLWYKLGL